MLKGTFATVNVVGRVRARLLLSRAKHPSLAGHPRIALRLARLMPHVSYGEARFFDADAAPPDVIATRRLGFGQLADELRARAPLTLERSAELEDSISDVAFTNSHRVPFQFNDYATRHLKVGCLVDAAEGAKLRDLDGNWAYDLGGGYGVNLFGVDFYKGCIERGVERVKGLGPVLGAYHPLITDNVTRLLALSGQDEVSFHMSGTEAVMQAVRLARFHTRRSHVVRFCGAYHGWWDGVQAGPGNPRPSPELYTLRELHPLSLEVLESRDDIACVLVNPIQALNPNGAPASDGTLVASDRKASYDRAAYAQWLAKLRDVCTRRHIALIFDEVFMGFRLAKGGVQEYFGVRADLVTYGKTLGGGLPVGVLCGSHAFMRRFHPERPADVCFARGTFNAHPYVMATMNEFLRALDEPAMQARYVGLDETWNARAGRLNAQLEQAQVPVRVANMMSVWTTLFTTPGRYNWLLQYYLRAQGLALSWIGTGRYIFSHDLSDADFEAIVTRFVAACVRMKADGWWLPEGALTNEAIKRSVMSELRDAVFSLNPSPRHDA